MSEKNLNTSVTLKQNTKPESVLKAEMERASAQVKAQKMVKLFIPEAYRGAFGDPLSFSVNGVRVEVPIGIEIEVPEPHYKHAQRLMKGAVISKNQRRLTPEDIYQD
jgi:hypothetical protein